MSTITRSAHAKMDTFSSMNDSSQRSIQFYIYTSLARDSTLYFDLHFFHNYFQFVLLFIELVPLTSEWIGLP